ncbi:MAG: transposase domain-containing protein [Acidobacteria bacterium]|nr:transposase domain-containing protein [Acidobacteriota bacterium]
MVETAKENKLAPFDYLNHLFEKLPNLESRDDETLDQFLPWNLSLQLFACVKELTLTERLHQAGSNVARRRA